MTATTEKEILTQHVTPRANNPNDLMFRKPGAIVACKNRQVMWTIILMNLKKALSHTSYRSGNHLSNLQVGEYNMAKRKKVVSGALHQDLE